MFCSVKVPASSANLGPGFDTLALALPLYLTVNVWQSKSFNVVIKGQGAHVEITEDHMAVRLAKDIIGHTNVKVVINSEIPVGRGLGSSGALAVALACAYGAKDPLKQAYKVEGHLENAAASYHGGLVVAKVEKDSPKVKKIAIDNKLRAIVIVPNFEIKTAEARKVLPKTYKREHVIKNLANLAFLINGLTDIRCLEFSFFMDYLHQPYRKKLFPESEQIINYARDCGALGACWSGSGSSLLVITEVKNVKSIADELCAFLKKIKILAKIYSFKPDQVGLRLKSN
jgi:homoserine kinase